MTHPLYSILKDVNGATFIGLDTETVPRINGGKANPFVGNVVKRSTGMSVMVFTNQNSNGYTNMVNKRLKEEGLDSYTPGERHWGTRIPGTPFVENKGQLYLEVICLSAPRKVEYLYKGKVIDKALITGLKESSGAGAQGGLVNKVQIRDFKFGSIKGIRVNKEEHTFI